MPRPEVHRGPALGERSAAMLPFLGLLLCGLVFLLSPPSQQSLRLGFFDQLQRWHPRPLPADRPVTLIDIDDDSLARLGQWPWPRSRMAELGDKLQALGSRVIAFDMLFSEPDRTSPQAVLDLWPLDADLRTRISALPDHDQRFAEMLAASPSVLGYALQNRPDAQTELPRKFGSTTRGALGEQALHRFEGRLASLEALEAAAAGVGHVSVVEDSDGVVRRVPAMVSLAGRLAPALGLEMLRVALGADNYMLSASSDERGIESIRIGSALLRTDPSGEAWLHYSAHSSEGTVAAWRLFADEPIAADAFRGKIVLIGSSASLLHDQRVTPRGEFVPGMEVHRQLIEQALSGRGLLRPGWVAAVEMLSLLLGGLVAIALASRLRSALAALSMAALLGASLWTSWRLFVGQGLLLDTLSPSLAWILCFVLASLTRLYRTERRQRWIRAAFSRYVSPNLVRHLIAHPEALELGGRRQQCSFIFTDLEGFTPLIERTSPQAAVALINEYLDGMIAIVFRHEGTLMRIVGDALAVMFSAPVVQSDHARRALACALEMDRFAREFAASRSGPDGNFCRTRVGVHSGEVTVGNFGGSSMLDYRALGDPINVAARLEAANKTLGIAVCVSTATLEQCPDAITRPIGSLMLRGKREPVEVREPISEADPAYDRAYRLLSAGSPEALPIFEELAASRPQDALVAFQLERLRRGKAGDRIVIG